MNEKEFIELLKEFCAKNNFTYCGRVKFNNKVLLVYIFGENCIEPFDKWLKANSAQHSSPTLFDKNIGSYVTLK